MLTPLLAQVLAQCANTSLGQVLARANTSLGPGVSTLRLDCVLTLEIFVALRAAVGQSNCPDP